MIYVLFEAALRPGELLTMYIRSVVFKDGYCLITASREGMKKDRPRIIKRLARKADVKKDSWPYLYRHTSLAAMSKVFTESRLEQFAG